mmetsp:Transcript_25711/g.64782  ORF Transcript_25711/g.64782 Transcript_25711/m.64782 type:complete len:205 (+) Transcript_25711:61-675(+)
MPACSGGRRRADVEGLRRWSRHRLLNFQAFDWWHGGGTQNDGLLHTGASGAHELSLQQLQLLLQVVQLASLEPALIGQRRHVLICAGAVLIDDAGPEAARELLLQGIDLFFELLQLCVRQLALLLQHVHVLLDRQPRVHGLGRQHVVPRLGGHVVAPGDERGPREHGILAPAKLLHEPRRAYPNARRALRGRVPDMEVAHLVDI